MHPLFTTADGNTYDPYRPANGAPLPAATFIVKFHPMRGFYLDKIENLQTPAHVYGKNHADRIMSAYLDRVEKGTSTGVWLTGEKGSGKTMLAAILSERTREKGMPTILVQEPLHGPGFNSFIEQLGQACILFDEYEKVYSEKSHQEAMLTVFAGSVVAKHLYILTTNSAWAVRDAMRNRPSRMRYFIEYRGLSDDVVEEYLTINLVDKKAIPDLIKALSQIENCNFDIMIAAVEEHNRFGGDVTDMLSIMNISREGKAAWDAHFEGTIGDSDFEGEKVVSHTTWEGNPWEMMGNGNGFFIRFPFVGKDEDPVAEGEAKVREKRCYWSVSVDEDIPAIPLPDGNTYVFKAKGDSTGVITITRRVKNTFSKWMQRF